jgi:DNA polymerase/3'-5' exonuclease PolX
VGSIPPASIPNLTSDNNPRSHRISRFRFPSNHRRTLVTLPNFTFFDNQSRRGAPESPEIDVLLTHPDYAKAIPDILRGSIADKHLLRSVIDKLHSSGHLTDETVFQVNRYDGIGQLPVSRADVTKPSPHRRIKFRFVAWDSFVFSQLYFTGTDAFIIHCREQAAKRGYRLSFDCLEKRIKTTMEVFGVDGLKYMLKDEKDDVKEGKMATVDSEEDLFAFLRMKYVPPHERNWY